MGTGNDLARVLGWGPSCDDDTQLPQILEKLERASTKMLDRWSIMTYEIKIPPKLSCPTTPEGAEDCQVLRGADRHSHASAGTVQPSRASRPAGAGGAGGGGWAERTLDIVPDILKAASTQRCFETGKGEAGAVTRDIVCE